MFGSILVMTTEDVIFSAALSVVVIVLYLFCYHKMFAVTFDESFARASGVRIRLYNLLISVLTAVTIVLGMRMMGAMLISSLIIFPALISMRLCKSFRGVVLGAAIVSVITFLIGLIASFWFSAPTGASVVLINLVFLLGAMAAEKLRGILRS